MLGQKVAFRVTKDTSVSLGHQCRQSAAVERKRPPKVTVTNRVPPTMTESDKKWECGRGSFPHVQQRMWGSVVPGDLA